jgi:predicted  nucleic acid-binding Zn-ribbon protein
MSENHIGVYLGKDLKAQWLAYCKARNLKAGAVLKDSIIEQIKAAELGDNDIYKSKIDKPDQGTKIRKEVRLTPSEWAAIEQRAKAEGSSVQHWMNCTVRASITQEPQFTNATIESLNKSSYELMAIGRNLNQIAKQMNQQFENASPTYNEIETLKKIIKEHMYQVSVLVSASAQRWKIKQKYI